MAYSTRGKSMRTGTRLWKSMMIDDVRESCEEVCLFVKKMMYARGSCMNENDLDWGTM